jgi:hypothetical protein
LFFFDLCMDDHDSFVIFRSASVRPKHLFDLYFDHDYSFKLPFQGAGCPIMCTMSYFTPCPVASCPTYEPNSNDGEYAHSFRHIQYKRTPSFRPIATLGNALVSTHRQGGQWKRRHHSKPATRLCPTRHNIKGRPFWSRVWVLASTPTERNALIWIAKSISVWMCTRKAFR